ncbi:MAG TPA: aminotransferase class IV [Terriglobales bacterium]|nr:aminotransferase class IV [Terriglobales bacterium]
MGPIHPFAWHNGALAPVDSLTMSPLQTGLLTGWGLFSTLRIYQGVPFAFADHWQRLSTDGAKLLVETAGLEAGVRQGLAAVIERNGPAAAEAVARVYLIRNRGGLLDVPQTQATDVLIFTRSLRDWGAAAKLRVQPHGRHAQAPLAGTKTLTWSHNLVLVEEAHAQGFDDVLLLNERGEVAECTSANIFVAKNGVLRTPPLSSGALPGVSRKLLLAHGAAHGLRLEEATLSEGDLARADEIFITSTTREVQPVERIGERAVPTGGPLTRQAETVFTALIADYLATHRRQEAHA